MSSPLENGFKVIAEQPKAKRTNQTNITNISHKMSKQPGLKKDVVVIDCKTEAHRALVIAALEKEGFQIRNNQTQQ